MKFELKIVIDTNNNPKIKIITNKQKNAYEYQELTENEKCIIKALANFIEYVANTV